jgi:hypothetical protein
MGIGSVFFGKSADLVAAEQALRKREDEVFQMQPGEDTDLAIHTRWDIPRHELLRGRIALVHALTRQSSNRNLAFMALGFAVVLAKLFGGFDLLLEGLKLL